MNGISIGITILVITLVPILFSGSLAHRSLQKRTGANLPLELRPPKWMYPLVGMGFLVGILCCFVPLLAPKPSFGFFVFSSAIGIPIALSGVMGTIKLSKSYIRLTTDTLSYRYGRKQQDIPLSRIKQAYTSIGYVILVTAEGNIVLPSYFTGTAELLARLRRECIQNQIAPDSGPQQGRNK